MGYSHHWFPRNVITPERWRAFTRDATALIEHYEGPGGLCSQARSPHVPPLVQEHFVAFNGRGNAGCEDFIITRQVVRKWHYCKTEHLPYDRLVCAMLAVFRMHFPQLVIHSDGKFSDWAPHINWASEVLKRPIRNPLRATRTKSMPQPKPAPQTQA